MTSQQFRKHNPWRSQKSWGSSNLFYYSSFRPRCQWVIRPTGERLDPKYVKTFKENRVTVMVWACFAGEKLGSSIVCENEGIRAKECEDILYDGLFSLIYDLLEPSEDPGTIQVATEDIYILMQDNASCHRSNEVLQFLEKHSASAPQIHPFLHGDFWFYKT